MRLTTPAGEGIGRQTLTGDFDVRVDISFYPDNPTNSDEEAGGYLQINRSFTDLSREMERDLTEQFAQVLHEREQRLHPIYSIGGETGSEENLRQVHTTAPLITPARPGDVTTVRAERMTAQEAQERYGLSVSDMPPETQLNVFHGGGLTAGFNPTNGNWSGIEVGVAVPEGSPYENAVREMIQEANRGDGTGGHRVLSREEISSQLREESTVSFEGLLDVAREHPERVDRALDAAGDYDL